MTDDITKGVATFLLALACVGTLTTIYLTVDLFLEGDRAVIHRLLKTETAVASVSHEPTTEMGLCRAEAILAHKGEEMELLSKVEGWHNIHEEKIESYRAAHVALCLHEGRFERGTLSVEIGATAEHNRHWRSVSHP